MPSDVPQVANTALTLRSALTTSYEDFAQQILMAVAQNKTTDIAKSIGKLSPSLSSHEGQNHFRQGHEKSDT